ncbi:hypothetical protein GCK32_014733 [Trichostrongylus colubriformis]|uniref:Uncharacterized protein n=1 Tax=Trichostrongylus colubriformis TaxID=6319 RepID=A0AAN8ICK3_TRICO
MGKRRILRDDVELDWHCYSKVIVTKERRRNRRGRSIHFLQDEVLSINEMFSGFRAEPLRRTPNIVATIRADVCLMAWKWHP